MTYLVNCNNLIVAPFPWKQPPVGGRQEALIQQRYDSEVLHGPNYSSRRLQYLIHARIPVGIVESVFSPTVKILL